MHKIAVIGDKDSVLCFKAIGMDVFPSVLANEETNRKLVDSLAKTNYAVIFITEEIATSINETIERYDKQLSPSIILIPSNKGSQGIGLAKIRDNVEKAVGINILD